MAGHFFVVLEAELEHSNSIKSDQTDNPHNLTCFSNLTALAMESAAPGLNMTYILKTSQLYTTIDK